MKMDEITIEVLGRDKENLIDAIAIEYRRQSKPVSISGGGMSHLRILLEIDLREGAEAEYKISIGE